LREDLRAVAEGLQNQWLIALDELDRVNRGESHQDPAALRKKANDLALKSTQAALAAAKGAGFASDHDVGRWCREAMFFLVWSCPQSVVQAHLCSFLS
jgi:alkylation response protein AidB-like acyl-CoA dehydrogenase